MPTAAQTSRVMATEQSGVWQGSKPMIVILVGLPGSGKSTFCDEVMKSGAGQWVRICQDLIGTKVRCIKKATEALKEKKNVFIDKCNLERDQRAEFIKLGKEQADIHAVVLDLPTQLCITRAVNRTKHEGGLRGQRAAIVINRMLQKKELPKSNEGFSCISVCHTQAEVEDLVDTYRKFGSSDSLTPGCSGQGSSDVNVQVGKMKIPKKLSPSENADFSQVFDAPRTKKQKRS